MATSHDFVNDLEKLLAHISDIQVRNALRNAVTKRREEINSTHERK